jgi:hypothetical protein
LRRGRLLLLPLLLLLAAGRLAQEAEVKRIRAAV